ncbi:MAG: hypothetical protein QXV17_06720 [Candidatus Micrarchaeaceae archaeon]
MLALVSQTLPLPQGATPAVNATIQNMNNTATILKTYFLNTVSALNKTLTNPTNGSFSANPTIYQAFAFILSGYGTVMTDIVMIPYLDMLSIQYIISGLSIVLPPQLITVVTVGVNLLVAYLLISMLLLGISAIQKYNLQKGG